MLYLSVCETEISMTSAVNQWSTYITSPVKQWSNNLYEISCESNISMTSPVKQISLWHPCLTTITMTWHVKQRSQWHHLWNNNRYDITCEHVSIGGHRGPLRESRARQKCSKRGSKNCSKECKFCLPRSGLRNFSSPKMFQRELFCSPPFWKFSNFFRTYCLFLGLFQDQFSSLGLFSSFLGLIVFPQTFPRSVFLFRTLIRRFSCFGLIDFWLLSNHYV